MDFCFVFACMVVPVKGLVMHVFFSAHMKACMKACFFCVHMFDSSCATALQQHSVFIFDII